MPTDQLVAILIGLVIILLGWILYWIAAIYFTLRRGLNEVIQGLAAIDGNLERMSASKDK